MCSIAVLVFIDKKILNSIIISCTWQLSEEGVKPSKSVSAAKTMFLVSGTVRKG